MASAPADSLDANSPLAALLSHAAQSARQESLDFSSLDAATFATLNEACAQMLQLKSQDSDLRLALAAKNKELEAKLERISSDRERTRNAADIAQRNEEAARALCAQAKAQFDESESSRKQVLSDLAQARRESQAVKAASRQQKQMAERSLARQRERFTDSGIAAARSQAQECFILPGVFAVGGEATTDSESLERKQIAELESQRVALLSSNAALRRLFSDALNVYSETASSIGAACPSKHMQSDLFPQGEPLRKDYVLSSKEGNHPAVRALSAVHQASEKAIAQLAQRESEVIAATIAKVSATQPATAEDNTATDAARRALESQVHTLRDRIRNQESELSSMRASVEHMRIQLVQAETRAAEAEVRSMRVEVPQRQPTPPRTKRSRTPESEPVSKESRATTSTSDVDSEPRAGDRLERNRPSTGANSSVASSASTSSSSNGERSNSEKRRRVESTTTAATAKPAPTRPALTARSVPNQPSTGISNKAPSATRRVVSSENSSAPTIRKTSSAAATTKPKPATVKPPPKQSALQEALEKRRKAAQTSGAR